MTLCECGCGEEVKPGNRFIKGHSFRVKKHTEEPEIVEEKPVKTDDSTPVAPIDINQPFDKYDAMNFFDGLAAWEPEEKKSIIKRIFNRGKKQELKTCVFVADGEESVVKMLPFDPNSQLLINPDTGEVFLRSLKGKIFFFDKYKCLPLCECPKVADEYDLPEHFALKFYNLGFGEAELSGYKALIEKINKWQLIVKLSMIVALLITGMNLYMFKTNADQVEAMRISVDVLSKMYGK